jgi:hypothetical protein
MVYARGAWNSDSDSEYEEFSDANATRSKAKSIANSALADLHRATSEVETERLRRAALRERRAKEEDILVGITPNGSKKPFASGLNDLARKIANEERLRLQGLSEHPAAEEKKLGPAVAKGNKKTASSDKSSDAVPAQSNVAGVSTNKVRRPLMKPSLNLGGSPSSSNTAVPAQSNASGVASNKPRHSPIDPSPNSDEQKTGRARAHDRGLLSLMDDFNARGGVHNAATRRLADRGLFSEDQLAAAAARAKLRADARADNAEATPETRLAAARARLATEGRVVTTLSQPASDSGVKATKLASQAPVRPESSQVPATLGASKLPTELKAKILFSAGAAQSDLSTADGVKHPVGNTSPLRQLLASEPKREIEAGRRCNGYPFYRAFPIHGPGQAPKSSAANPASSAASTTTTTPSQSVSKKVQAILRYYGNAMNICDDASAAAFVAHKLTEDAYQFDFGAAESSSMKPATVAASAIMVSEKVQAVVRRYGNAMNALDDASAAAFVAHKLKEDADRIKLDAAKRHATTLTPAAKTTATTSSQSVSEKAQAIAHRYASSIKASKKLSQKVVSQNLDGTASSTDINAGNETSAPAQHKAPATNHAQGPNGLAIKPDVAKAVEVEDGFDVLNSKGPSAANGSPLPDPDLSMNQLDVQFSPTLKGFQGWEDDYDSDDSEEWDLGGLAEWKWVGEKSAKENKRG